ncbi:hypothetical protein F511_39245 [Dorcoceras hygrometricum]|uniref:Uncharacterized protein n=1 Tax=Dorcoceras hygrometricum TaxID=472368 RepID=A0A2Z7C6F5_9LAMI|nr:hypothetical protein F511_39245 [Dorcoceras hygrometricum]
MVTSCFLLLCIGVAIADLQRCVLDVVTGTSFWKVFTREKPADDFRRAAGGIFDDVAIQISRACFVVIVAQKYKDVRASGNTALSSSLLGLLATMRRVVNYHSSWTRQRQVELFDESGNPGFTAGRGFNPAGGAP